MDEYSWLTDEVVANEEHKYPLSRGETDYLHSFGSSEISVGPHRGESWYIPADIYLARSRQWKARQEGAALPTTDITGCTITGTTAGINASPEFIPGDGSTHKGSWRKQTEAEFFADTDRAHESMIRDRGVRQLDRQIQARIVSRRVMDDQHVAALVMEGER